MSLPESAQPSTCINMTQVSPQASQRGEEKGAKPFEESKRCEGKACHQEEEKNETSIVFA